MKTKFFYLISSLIISSILNFSWKFNFTIDEIIKSPFESNTEISTRFNYIDQYMKTQICIGAIDKCFNTIINLNSVISWVPDASNPQSKISKYNSKQSKFVLEEATFKFSDRKQITGSFYDDILYLPGNAGTFRFLSSKNSNSFSGCEGEFGLGFPRESADEQMSVLSFLYKNNKINHMIFYIEFTNKTKGYITIGEFPSVIINDYKKYATCVVEESDDINGGFSDNKIWSCKIDGLLLGDIKQNKTIKFNKKTAIFDYRSKRSLLPIMNILKLEKEYFAKPIDNGDCNFGIKNNYYTFTCYENDFDELNNITMVFSDWGVTIPKKNLFVYDDIDKEYEFIFYAKDGFDGIVIGSDILKIFIVVFDVNNENIGFYSSDIQPKRLSEDDVKPPKTYREYKLEKEKEDKQIYVLSKRDDDKKELSYNPLKTEQLIINEKEQNFLYKKFIIISILSIVIIGFIIIIFKYRFFRKHKVHNKV